MDHDISLYFPQRAIEIGTRAGSHIHFTAPKDTQILLKLHENGEWMLFIQGEEGITVNDRFWDRSAQGICLNPGDMLHIGPIRMEFKVLPSSGGGKEREYIHVPPRDDSFEVATETLRIVEPPLAPLFSRKMAVHLLALAIVLLASYLLITGKLLPVRSYLSQTFPISISQNQKDGKEDSSPASDEIVQQKPGDAKEEEAHSERTGPEKEKVLLALKNFFPPDISLKLKWEFAGEVPLVLVQGATPKVRMAQHRMFEEVRKGNLAEAEMLYSREIFPDIYGTVKALENAVKYNGWALRLHRMLWEWKNTKDPQIYRQITEELKILKLQTELCVKSLPCSHFFQKLIRDISRKLEEK